MILNFFSRFFHINCEYLKTSKKMIKFPSTLSSVMPEIYNTRWIASFARACSQFLYSWHNLLRVRWQEKWCATMIHWRYWKETKVPTFDELSLCCVMLPKIQQCKNPRSALSTDSDDSEESYMNFLYSLEKGFLARLGAWLHVFFPFFHQIRIILVVSMQSTISTWE